MAHQLRTLHDLTSTLGRPTPRGVLTGAAPRLSRAGAGPRAIRAFLMAGSRDGGAGDDSAADLAYASALELSRQQQYGAARDAFEELLRAHPDMCKGWVSYAQMEKRVGRLGDPQRLYVARYILQRGLTVNPGSACLAQAWGLLELQRGNWWAAVRLLERCVSMDASNAPVLRWQPVQSARQTVSSRPGRGARRARGASVVPAAGGGGGGGAGGAAALGGGREL
ncbi:MAG: hypothetical protein J3K34DRAFT_517996 [Monoraphidium minutum]|nr:MAG: hypothetical protein J3K34DRAFT_517996 [Monoraphidium minutum]